MVLELRACQGVRVNLFLLYLQSFQAAQDDQHREYQILLYCLFD